MKHTITLDTKEVINLELSQEQLKWIEDGLRLQVKVPLYSTTCAKSKYGDCIIGNILTIK